MAKKLNHQKNLKLWEPRGIIRESKYLWLIKNEK
jgi:hypothetical protein